MSAVERLAKPHRIKAAHRWRWKCSTGHSLYANDNPYRYTDPDGRYSCSGSKDDCSTVANYYNAAVKSMGNMKKGSSEYKATAAAVKYLGKPGEKNGVTVTVATLKPGIYGDAPKGGIRISVSNISTVGAALSGRYSGKTTDEVQNAIGAGVLAHEATHEVDYGNVGYPHSRAADHTTEVHAYTEEKAVRSALGVPRPDLSTPQGFNNAVNQSVNVFCSDSRNGC